MLEYAHPETLVESHWLTEHLADPQYRIIEMDLDSQSYDAGHLPGAIFWSPFSLMLPNMATNFAPQAMEKLLSDSGISNDTTVIAVHENYTATSGWIFWLLKIFGHQKVKILNGGRQKWQEDGFPVTNQVTTITPSKYNIQDLDYTLRISTTEVRKSLNKSDRILLDARTVEEYQGKIYLQAPPQANERAGHILGAVNIYYELAHNDDSTFKSASQLQKIYSDLDITPDKLIIPYCAVGARSAHTWFILKYLLGYPQVKNYDGSWNEWSKLPDPAQISD